MVEVTFLTAQDSADAQHAQITRTAKQLADFISKAELSLRVAIYDFRQSGDEIVNALNERADAGVVVRVAYFQPKEHHPKTTEEFGAIGADPAPGPDPAFFHKFSRNVVLKGISEVDLRAEKEAINGVGHLMHDKYVVRDGMTPKAALWTGSANFTDDAFSLQENNILVIENQDLCQFYETDFAEMWTKQSISGTGKDDTGEATVDTTTIDVSFAPGQGRSIDHEIASRIAAAKNEVRICCMVISSAGILGAVIDAASRGVKVTGVFDATQMRGVEKDWEKSPASTQSKLPLWQQVKALLVGKNSHPYTPDGPHDFMHNKVAVIDSDTVITGSFNFSNNATRNAENVLFIEDADIAQKYAAYVDGLIARFGAGRQPAAFADATVSDPAAAEAAVKDSPVTKHKRGRKVQPAH